MCISIGYVSFQHLGLPGDVMEKWINKTTYMPKIPRISSQPKPLKHIDIPILSDYSKDPPQDFWDIFPSNPLPSPTSPNTPIHVGKLETEYLSLKHRLHSGQQMSILHSINDLRFGADSLVDFNKIGPLHDTNAVNMRLSTIGSFYTDQLVTMIKDKYVSGPFDISPFPNARINSLFVIEQTDKYRPILNLSSPPGNCFNEAIDDLKMTKVKMSSPSLVAKKLFSIGSGAIMSKIDHRSAYKLIPTKFDHLHLQGFVWLNKTFFETSQIFGARSAVPNYDRTSHNISTMVRVKTNTPTAFLERQLDDQIIVTETLDENESFVNEYIRLAKSINLPLAPFDKPDKAFLYQTKGIILGTVFDTVEMTWSLSLVKRVKIMSTIIELLSKTKVYQLDLQRALGMINQLIQLCPPLKFIRAPIIQDLKNTYEKDPIFLSSSARDFFHNWLFIIAELEAGFPITNNNNYPPAKSIVFVTDAAGCTSPSLGEYTIGIGAVGYVMPHSEMSDFFYVGQCTWPEQFITILMDDNGKRFGNKTTLLETIGLLVALYHNYALIHNKHVICQVDNIAVVWAYINGKSRQDPYTSLMISVINHIAVCSPFKLYVEHLPRVSTLPALIADTLSRTDPKGQYLIDTIGQPIKSIWPPSLYLWLQNPVLDWSLRSKLLWDFRTTL